MIYWLYELLKEDHEALVRVLRYVSSRSLAAALFAFLISLVMGPWVVRKLLSLKMGQPIRTAEDMRELAEIHGRKQGTHDGWRDDFSCRGHVNASLCSSDEPFHLVVPYCDDCARKSWLSG